MGCAQLSCAPSPPITSFFPLTLLGTGSLAIPILIAYGIKLGAVGSGLPELHGGS